MANPLLYEQFTPDERLSLMLQALARQDDVEAQRLSRSCPRRTYTMAEAAYGDRIEAAFDVMAVACIDLRCCWGELQMLQRVIGSLAEMDQPYRAAARIAFLQGIRWGRGEPPLVLTDEPDDEDDDDENDDDDDDDDDVRDKDSEQGDGDDNDDGGTGNETDTDMTNDRDDDGDGDDDRPCLVDGLDAASVLVQKASETMCRGLLDSAQPIACAFLTAWEALDRFSQRRLGVTGGTLLAAFGFQVVADAGKVQRRHPLVRPDETKVAEYDRCLETAWAKRFGAEKPL